MKVGSSFAPIAYTMLALSIGALVLSLAYTEIDRHREVKSLSHTFSLVWRVANIDGGIDNALQAESRDDTQTVEGAIGQLRLNVEALPHFLEGLETDLGEPALAAVGRMNNTIGETSSSSPQAAGKEQWRERLTSLRADNSVLKEMLDAHTTSLAQAPPKEAQAHRNGILGLSAFVALLVGIFMIQLRSRERQLEANYLRSVGAFHAHFLQSRITAIRLFLDSATAKAKSKKASLHEAIAAVEELDSIQQTLRRANYIDPTGATAGLRDVVASMLLQYPAVDIGIEPETSDVQVPDPQVRFMLEQLLSNAATAVQQSNSPRIEIAARPSYNWRFSRRYIVLEVSDNGNGIDAAIADEVIRPFFTTKSGPHNGLGLTAVSQMAQALGGSLSIKSQTGSGTVVSVSFPV